MGNACCAEQTVDESKLVMDADILQQKLHDERLDTGRGHSATSRIEPDAKPGPMVRSEIMTHTKLPPHVRAGMKPGPPPEFLIEVDRSNGQTLGVDVITDKDSLLIEAVTGGGFQEWNDEHPDLFVDKGYRITAVNGIRQGPQMAAECQKGKILDIWIKRCP